MPIVGGVRDQVMHDSIHVFSYSWICVLIYRQRGAGVH
eukprot:XP_001707995.1 Hypothetical protein GL50803_36260 [Giardia lamblia ATCC 50803]